jgi:hypothetical protein
MGRVQILCHYEVKGEQWSMRGATVPSTETIHHVLFITYYSKLLFTKYCSNRKLFEFTLTSPEGEVKRSQPA